MSIFFEDFYQNRTSCFATATLQQNVNHPYNDKMVKACIDSLSAEPGSKISQFCRVYIAGRQVDPFEAKCLMQAVSSFPSLDAIDWSAFGGGSEFMIFLNYAALYSSEMASASHKFIGNFCARFEPDGVSIEHHLIIGHYSETPFGVHVDDATDRVFHFNLGPNAKEMILWQRNEFLNTYARDTARPLSRTARMESINYNIPAGSCFFLPADYYHVGSSSKGVSIVLALALSRQNFDLQLKAAMKEMRNFARLSDRNEKYYTDFSARPNSSDFESSSRILCEIGLETLLEHARARRRSNNNFAEIRSFTRSSLKPGLARYKFSCYTPPQLVRTNGTLHLYSRGHHAKLTDAAQIDKLEAVLSRPYFELGQNALNEGIAMGDLVVVMLAWLIATGGVQPMLNCFEEPT